jgi:hypothetical protein
MNDYMQKTLSTKKSFAARQYFSNMMDGYNSENNIFEFKNASISLTVIFNGARTITLASLLISTEILFRLLRLRM